MNKDAELDKILSSIKIAMLKSQILLVLVHGLKDAHSLPYTYSKHEDL